LENPAGTIAELDYLGASEKEQLLRDFNNTSIANPRDRTIVDLLEEQAGQHPDAIAVVFEEIELTYRELNERSNQLGWYLREKYDIRADDLIGIKVERSEWMILAILGVLKSGGAYVPIDPDYPSERIAYMLEDSRCKVLIDEQELEAFKGLQKDYPVQNLPSVSVPASLAYVIYTSGSTGKPKGVLIEQKSVINYNSWFLHAYQIGKEEGTLLLSSFTFDGVITSLFGALLSGNSIYVISKEMVKSPRQLAGYIRNNKVSFLKITPSYLNAMVSDDECFELLTGSKHLRLIIIGGEAINVGDIKKIKRRAGHISLVNHYGPTETTVGVIAAKIEDAADRIPIGKPIFNTAIYMLDRENRLVPVGVVGEICVGGAGLARGYLNQPELTAAKFVSNPFKAGERMYRTGDLGRWLPDGSIEFLGRKDDQVKIRGYRIELGEIENTLRRYPGIESAIVIVRSHPGMDSELVAYLVGKKALNISDLRAYLGKSLPAYMLPGHYVQLESLPVTHIGKVDKTRLPDPAMEGMTTGREYMAPRNEVE
ncbi:MAG: amino acid adenylation domain-containing protein, partial [Bacteroidota bacterium]